LYFMRKFMSFEKLNLDPQIFKALQACGYDIPTPIQERSIPEILAGKDVVASAQTGTGKTAAFVLPALHRLTLASGKNIKPRVLILTPTRELASQITLAASKYGKFLRFSIISLVGGMPYRQQLKELSRPVDIIVATPGRLLDHMSSGRLDLSEIEMLVLDEADRMLDMGFIDDVKTICNAIPDTRQTLLFSATVDDRLSHIIRQLLKNPVRIDVGSEKMSPVLIKQEAYMADNQQHKERLLKHFLENGNIFKAIIFSGTKINADYLARRLSDQGFEAAPLHGDLKQNVRNRTIELLRRGKINFLVATDVAARGIDINDVTHVINYDLPKFSEDYVHRIGRTGRAGKTGIAISLVSPLDGKHLQKIERYTKQKLEFSVIPGLEPTKRMNNNASATTRAGGKKKFGGGKSFEKGHFKSGGGYGKGSEARSGYSARKGGSSDGYVKRDAAPRGDFADRRAPRDNDTRDSYYAKKDSAPRGDFAERRAPRDSEARGSYARKDNAPRGDFAERRTPRDSEARGGYARKDSAPRGDFSERRSFAKPSEGRGGYAKRDDAAPRGEFAGRRARNSGEARPSFPKKEGAARSDFSERRSTRPSESKTGYVRKDSAPRGDFSERRSFSKPSESRGGYARKDSAPRGDFAERRSPRSSEAKESFSRKDADPRISYAPRKPAKSNDSRGSFAKNDGRRSFAKSGGKDKKFRE
jgi:superfamily II DNA/RNA helicase